MTPNEFMAFLHKIENLKNVTRHSWTSAGRHESVAEHSYRLSLMAFLLRDEFPALDMRRVLDMCVIHDFGEAVTGDIPSFLKTAADEDTESRAVGALLSMLPDRRDGLAALFEEMEARKTPEARLFKALDRLEAVIQHNEAPIETWEPIEYELNLNYGAEDCAEFPFMAELREIARAETEEKTAKKE